MAANDKEEMGKVSTVIPHTEVKCTQNSLLPKLPKDVEESEEDSKCKIPNPVFDYEMSEPHCEINESGDSGGTLLTECINANMFVKIFQSKYYCELIMGIFKRIEHGTPFYVNIIGLTFQPSMFKGAPDAFIIQYEKMDENLKEFITRYELNKIVVPMKRIKSIMHNILIGVSWLHTNNLAHCNIHSRNILMKNGFAKLDDVSVPRYEEYNPLSIQVRQGKDIYSIGLIFLALHSICTVLIPGTVCAEKMGTMFSLPKLQDLQRFWKLHGYSECNFSEMLLEHYNPEIVESHSTPPFSKYPYQYVGDALDFAKALLSYPSSTLTAVQALNHPYFKMEEIDMEDLREADIKFAGMNRHFSYKTCEEMGCCEGDVKRFILEVVSMLK